MVSDTGRVVQVRYATKRSSGTINTVSTIKSPNSIVWEVHGHHEQNKDSKNVLSTGVKKGIGHEPNSY